MLMALMVLLPKDTVQLANTKKYYRIICGSTELRMVPVYYRSDDCCYSATTTMLRRFNPRE
jgi:hypothetical protein